MASSARDLVLRLGVMLSSLEEGDVDGAIALIEDFKVVGLKLVGEWEEAKHPRYPAGHPKGGQFVSKTGVGESSQSESASGKTDFKTPKLRETFKAIQVGLEEGSNLLADAFHGMVAAVKQHGLIEGVKIELLDLQSDIAAFGERFKENMREREPELQYLKDIAATSGKSFEEIYNDLSSKGIDPYAIGRNIQDLETVPSIIEEDIPGTKAKSLSVNLEAQIAGDKAAKRLRRRVSELVELEARSANGQGALVAGEDIQAQIDWRVAMLQAESKYGDLIVSLSNNDATFQKKYSELLDRLKAGKGVAPQIRELTPKERNFRNKIDKRIKITGSEAVHPSPRLRNQIIAEGQAEVSEIMSLAESTSPDDLIVIDITVARGYKASEPLPGLEGSTFINLGMIGDTKETAAHEAGHVIEVNANAYPLTHQFLLDRAVGDKSRPFEVLPGEYVIRTDLPEPYTGKDYGVYGINSTEVVSMAIQQLESAVSLHQYANQDREHLMLGLAVLDMPRA